MTEAFLYKWHDKANDMFYVGYHKGRPDDGYICSSKYMKPEYEKRPQDFERTILLYGESKYVREMESRYLVAVDAAKDKTYYNKHNTYPYFTTCGYVTSEETKKKLSIIGKTRVFTEQHRQRLSEASKGHKRGLGAKRTEEVKRKMGLLKIGNKNWLGRSHTEEAKKKVSQARKGMKFSESHLLNMSLSRLGKKKSEATKAKMSASRKGNKYNLGKTASEEARQAMREAQRLRRLREKQETIH
jgi:hypothetical protein